MILQSLLLGKFVAFFMPLSNTIASPVVFKGKQTPAWRFVFHNLFDLTRWPAEVREVKKVG